MRRPRRSGIYRRERAETRHGGVVDAVPLRGQGPLLVQEGVHKSFAVLVGQPGPVEAALLVPRDDSRLKAFNGPIESGCAGNKAQHSRASAARRQAVQVVQNLRSRSSVNRLARQS